MPDLQGRDQEADQNSGQDAGQDVDQDVGQDASRDASQDVDVVVIGLGPGGELVAGELAEAGLDVVGVEARLVGGECPYYACVPTKMIVRAAESLAEARRVRGLAGSAQVQPDWAPVARRIRMEATDDWNDRVAVERLEGKGVRVVRGRGRLTARGEVSVTTDRGELRLRARRAIVLNPGTQPSVPPIDGLADVPFWTNRDAVAVAEVPASLVVLGGGPVGLEFAQGFSRFGTKVTVIEAAPRLLSAGEPEAAQAITEVLESEGIRVLAGVKAQRVRHANGEVTVELDSGEGEPVSGERLLVAAGRHTDLAALGVGAVGLDESAKNVEVDERMRAAEGVWAIGDVTGRGAFTHVSMYQARIAVADVLGRDGETADYRALPVVTFTDPEVGQVGLTEAAARERGLTVHVGRSDVASSARGWIHQAEGLIKLVSDVERDVLVGATVVAPGGGEVLGTLAVAVHGEVPVGRLRSMIYAYPTFHRGIEDALNDLGAG